MCSVCCVGGGGGVWGALGEGGGRGLKQETKEWRTDAQSGVEQ